MNKIVLWVKSYFLYGQLSQEDYERVKTAAAVNNHKSVANLSLISSTIFLILTIISLSSDQAFWAAKFKSYLIGLII